MALTLTRIDGDVIEEFLRYSARFVDHHYVAIMGAADGTREIVDALIAEGLSITAWRLSDSASVEADVTMTAPFARLIFEQTGCDYILPIDADEFVVADGREHLRSVLEALPPGAHAAAYWSTYIPTNDDDVSEMRVLARIKNRRQSETHCYAKIFINRSFASDPQATIVAGNHAIDGAQWETIALRDIRLAHFPVRSLVQIQSKALVGSSAFLASGHGERSPLGYQWHLAFERLFEEHKGKGSDDLRHLAANYLGRTPSDADVPEILVYDPLPSVARVYTGDAPDVLEISMKLTVAIARAYGNLRNSIMPPPLNPDGQWPSYDAALGELDPIHIVDGARLELRGWMALANSPLPPTAVYALFPGKKIALSVSDCNSPERKKFSGSIDLNTFEDGLYVVRIFAVGDYGRWFALGQNPIFEKRADSKVLG